MNTVSRTKVLVAYASRMGSTAEIAEAIAAQLRSAGLEVILSPCDSAPEAGGFDAVVCGSAIYATRWDKSARRYLHRNLGALAERPTWLFESGPCGPTAQQRHETSAYVLRAAGRIGCDTPRVFGGNLDPARATSRIARWVANSDLAGDYRDWAAIRTWADSIGRRLVASESSG